LKIVDIPTKVFAMTHPEVITAVTNGTDFKYPDFPDCLRYDQDIGFLIVQGSETDSRLTVFGYSPLPDGAELPPLTFSRTDLAFVPPQDRTIDKQGKGVGLRLYNTPHALAGRAEQTARIAAYTAEISLDGLLDTRRSSDRTPLGKIERIGRHAGRIIRAHTQGLDVVVNEIHQTYGDAQCVLFGQPPRAKLRELMRGVHAPIASEFMIVRGPDVALYGAGVRYAI
jgi:hypothetical protein